MKVCELQAKLNKLDPNLEVICYSEDEKLLAPERGFVLLDIQDVGTIRGEKLRLEDGTPYLRLDAPHSNIMAMIEITSDF